MAKEFRGCKNLVFAEVTADTSANYSTGTVKVLAPVAEISKSVETSSDSHYYDNRAAIVIDSEGKDTVSFTIAIPNDAVLAEITGRTYDATKKMFIESERTQKYFAVGYVLGEKGEGEDERYVWRYKGTFNIPDETAATEDDGTDANNMELEFTGIYTEHIFTNGKGTGVAGSAKAAFIRESANIATQAQWFAQVSTPDTTFPTSDYTLTITADTGTSAIVTDITAGTTVATGGTLVQGHTLVIAAAGGAATVTNGSSATVTIEAGSSATITVAGNVTVAVDAD